MREDRPRCNSSAPESLELGRKNSCFFIDETATTDAHARQVVLKKNNEPRPFEWSPRCNDETHPGGREIIRSNAPALCLTDRNIFQLPRGSSALTSEETLRKSKLCHGVNELVAAAYGKSRGNRVKKLSSEDRTEYRAIRNFQKLAKPHSTSGSSTARFGADTRNGRAQNSKDNSGGSGGSRADREKGAGNEQMSFDADQLIRALSNVSTQVDRRIAWPDRKIQIDNGLAKNSRIVQVCHEMGKNASYRSTDHLDSLVNCRPFDDWRKERRTRMSEPAAPSSGQTKLFEYFESHGEISSRATSSGSNATYFDKSDDSTKIKNGRNSGVRLKVDPEPCGNDSSMKMNSLSRSRTCFDSRFQYFQKCPLSGTRTCLVSSSPRPLPNESSMLSTSSADTPRYASERGERKKAPPRRSGGDLNVENKLENKPSCAEKKRLEAKCPETFRRSPDNKLIRKNETSSVRKTFDRRLSSSSSASSEMTTLSPKRKTTRNGKLLANLHTQITQRQSERTYSLNFQPSYLASFVKRQPLVPKIRTFVEKLFRWRRRQGRDKEEEKDDATMRVLYENAVACRGERSNSTSTNGSEEIRPDDGCFRRNRDGLWLVGLDAIEADGGKKTSHPRVSVLDGKCHITGERYFPQEGKNLERGCFGARLARFLIGTRHYR